MPRSAAEVRYQATSAELGQGVEERPVDRFGVQFCADLFGVTLRDGVITALGCPELVAGRAGDGAFPVVGHQVVGPSGLAHFASRGELGHVRFDVQHGSAIDGI